MLFSIGAFLLWVFFGAYLPVFSGFDSPLFLTVYLVGLPLIPSLSFLAYLFCTKKLMSHNCSKMHYSVIYKGIEGEWHTILFKNRQYAELFAKANDGLLDSTPSHEVPLF
jgi:hypothetical protein